MKEGEDMKKYTLTLLFFTMFAWMFQNIYATDDFTFEEVNIEDEVTLNKSTYEEGIEVRETGSVTVLKFYARYADKETADPLQGVEIEIFYETTDGKMRSLYALNSFANLNLVSDKDGEIRIENIPYGMYKFTIKNAPVGFSNVISDKDTFEVTPYDYETYTECYLSTIIPTFGGSGKLMEAKADFITKPPIVIDDPRPGQETMGTDPTTPASTENVDLDNAGKATGAVNPETTKTETPVQEVEQNYAPTTKQVEVLGNLYESAKTDFKVKEDAEDINIEDIPLSATIPVKIEMSKKDAIVAMRQIRITEQIKIATTNMDSTLSELYRLSNVPDDKKR